MQGAAAILRDYEGLPSAPGVATIEHAAVVGSGVANTAATLAPGIGAVVANTLQSAKAKGIALDISNVIEAVARGLDAVAGAKLAILEGRARQLAVVCLAGTPGEAP